MSAHRLLGLAAFNMRSGHLDEARRMLELAERAGVDAFPVMTARARLAILEGDADGAMSTLMQARDVDPFDEDAADLLGQVLMQRGDSREALAAFVDARILGGTQDPERVRYYGQCIGQLVEQLGLSPEERTELDRERASRLEELAEEADDLVEEQPAEPRVGDAPHPAPPAERPMRDVLALVAPFSSLGENELRLLECTMDRLRFPQGLAVFREGQPSEDLFVVESGKIVIQRDTPFGSQVLASIGANGVFGEMNFIDGRSRSADAVASEDTVLLRIAHESLRRIFDVEPMLAFVFLEQFWRGLADKVRESNELMKNFFPEGEGAPPPPKAPAPAAQETGRDAGVGHEQKASVLHEKGLSGEEMKILAEFAEARTFDAEEAVFREGDPGGTLFIVFEGRVRIEKHIPGVGQEALAILERGDFFGEMSVVDEAPRSASAIAHVPGTTVLAISKAAIDRLLETRGATAHSFLLVLCRILSSRLREINDKIVQWRFMSGGF